MRLDSLINVITDYARRLGAIAGYGYRQQESEFFEAYGDEGVAVFVSPDPSLPAYPGYYGYRIAAEGSDGGQMLDRLRFLLRTDCDIRYDRSITYGGGVWAYAVSLRLKAKKYGIGGGGSTPTAPYALNFTMPNGGTVILRKNGSPNAVSLEVSTDNENWQPWELVGTDYNYPLGAGQTLYIRNTSTTFVRFSTGSSNYYQFVFDNNVEASGSVMSLSVNDETVLSLTGADYNFYRLFNGCTKLVSAPNLPATILSSSCYREMFSSCSSLVESPELPAVLLKSYCYTQMFYFCSSLKKITTRMEDISATACLIQWTLGVYATGDFYCPADLNIPLNSISGIPSGWTRHDI